MSALTARTRQQLQNIHLFQVYYNTGHDESIRGFKVHLNKFQETEISQAYVL